MIESYAAKVPPEIVHIKGIF